jgi:hypothetical protein
VGAQLRPSVRSSRAKRRGRRWVATGCHRGVHLVVGPVCCELDLLLHPYLCLCGRHATNTVRVDAATGPSWRYRDAPPAILLQWYWSWQAVWHRQPWFGNTGQHVATDRRGCLAPPCPAAVSKMKVLGHSAFVFDTAAGPAGGMQPQPASCWRVAGINGPPAVLMESQWREVAAVCP